MVPDHGFTRVGTMQVQGEHASSDPWGPSDGLFRGKQRAVARQNAQRADWPLATSFSPVSLKNYIKCLSKIFDELPCFVEFSL